MKGGGRLGGRGRCGVGEGGGGVKLGAGGVV